VSGTQIITATLRDELARSRSRGWNLIAVIVLALAIAWVFPRLDQSGWSMPPAVIIVGLLGGAVGAAHRQRMFGRKRVSQITAALFTASSAAALLAVVLLVNRVVGAPAGQSPLEQGLMWFIEQGFSPFAPAAIAGVLLLLWLPFVIESQQKTMAEAAVWRSTHGPDGFTPIA
jgi:hypothetical protein